MAVTSAGRRAVTALIAVAGLSLLTSLVATAQAQGATRENLQAHGWTCVEFAPANRWSCFNPGVGRPFPANPDPAPSYNFLGFDLTTGELPVHRAPDPTGPVPRTAVLPRRRPVRLPRAHRLLRVRPEVDDARFRIPSSARLPRRAQRHGCRRGCRHRVGPERHPLGNGDARAPRTHSGWSRTSVPARRASTPTPVQRAPARAVSPG